MGTPLSAAAVDGRDATVLWAGQVGNARMGQVFDVGWTPGGRLVTGMGVTTLIDPQSGTIANLHIGEFRGVVSLAGGHAIGLLGTHAERYEPTGGSLSRVWRRLEQADGKVVVEQGD